MSVIANNLTTKEMIVSSARIIADDIKYKAMGLAGLGLVLVMFGGSVLVLLASIPVVLHLLSGLLEVVSTEMSLTNQRVIAKHGFFNHGIDSMTWRQIESVTVYQSFMGRYFNYGTVNFFGVGGERIFARNVHNPTEFRKKAINSIESV